MTHPSGALGLGTLPFWCDHPSAAGLLVRFQVLVQRPSHPL